MQNLIDTLQAISPQIDNAIKSELENSGHSKSGSLQNSVVTTLVQANDTLQLQTYMLDYWQFLEAKYGFLSHAIDPLLTDIMSNITKAINADIAHSINQIFQR